MKRYLFASLLITLLFSACAARPAQTTFSAEDQNAIAVAVAMTMMAQNSAAVEDAPAQAIATQTSPIVMVSVDNPNAIPGANVFEGAAIQEAASDGTESCDRVLKISEAGGLSKVRFNNKSGGVAQLNVFLWKENAFGQCGYFAGNPMSIAKDQRGTINLPEGDYFAWAWVTYNNGETSAPKGNFVIGVGKSGVPVTSEVVIRSLEISP